MTLDDMENSVWRVHAASEEETATLAHEVVALLRRGDMVTLSGDLGAGPRIGEHPPRFTLQHIRLADLARGRQVGEDLVGNAVPKGQGQVGRHRMPVGLALEFRIQEAGGFQDGQDGNHSEITYLPLLLPKSTEFFLVSNWIPKGCNGNCQCV